MARERKSLCEESMLVIVNILKFSSLSLAAGSLSVAGDPPPPARKLSKFFSGSGSFKKKAQKAPEGPSKRSYVMLPAPAGNADEPPVVVRHGGRTDGGDGRFGDYIRRFHEKNENEIEKRNVEDYIKRFHEKNLKDASNESKRMSYVALPPHRHLNPSEPNRTGKPV